jgi:type VI protein secretion system component Hcp
MRKLNATVIIAIAILLTAASQSASAGGAKSGPNLYKQTASGKHIDNAKITARTKTKGKGAVTPSISEIPVTKRIDKSSP